MQRSEDIFTEIVSVTEKKRSALKENIRSQQRAEITWVKEFEEKLEKEIAELWEMDAELEQLSHTDDHIQFLHKYPLVSNLCE